MGVRKITENTNKHFSRYVYSCTRAVILADRYFVRTVFEQAYKQQYGSDKIFLAFLKPLVHTKKKKSYSIVFSNFIQTILYK